MRIVRFKMERSQMNPRLLTVLGCLCFGAGWVLDSWAGGKSSPAGSVSRYHAASAPSTAGREQDGKETGANRQSVKAPVHSVDDLLNLVTPGPTAALRVRVERALAGLSASDLARFAVELRSRQPANDWFPVAYVYERLAVRWITLEPIPAIEFALKERSPQGEIGDAIANAMGKVFTADRAAAVRILGEMQDRELYIYSRCNCIEAMKGMSPPDALALIVEIDSKTRNEWYGAQALGEFPDEWVKTDPAAAMNWALTLPPGFTRREILRGMGTLWAAADAGAYQAFMAAVPSTTLPKGAARNGIDAEIRLRESRLQKEAKH
jgi:hypothetical protein